MTIALRESSRLSDSRRVNAYTRVILFTVLGFALRWGGVVLRGRGCCPLFVD